MTKHLESLREIAAAATQAEWLDTSEDGWTIGTKQDVHGVIGGCGCCGSPQIEDENFAYILAFQPRTVLRLLKVVEAADAWERAAPGDQLTRATGALVDAVRDYWEDES